MTALNQPCSQSDFFYFVHVSSQSITSACGRVVTHATERNLRANLETFVRSLLSDPCVAPPERSSAHPVAVPECGQLLAFAEESI